MRLNYAIVFVSDMRRSVAAVPSVDDFHEKMREKGVRCLQPPRTVFGARIAQYADPDGLAISVGEERAGDPHGHEGARK